MQEKEYLMSKILITTVYSSSCGIVNFSNSCFLCQVLNQSYNNNNNNNNNNNTIIIIIIFSIYIAQIDIHTLC